MQLFFVLESVELSSLGERDLWSMFTVQAFRVYRVQGFIGFRGLGFRGLGV